MSQNDNSYTIQESAELQSTADDNFSELDFSGEDSISGTQGCSLSDAIVPKEKDGEENPDEAQEDCDFTKIVITKEKRNFTFEWSKSGGIAPDVNNDTENIYEVVLGAEKGGEITVEKPDLTGPCKERNNHAGHSWDIEGIEKPKDKKVLLPLKPKPTKWDQLQNYLPYNIEPANYKIKAIKCGGWRNVNVSVYPDTELILDGDFTFHESERERVKVDEITKNELKKKEKNANLSLEYKKDGNQVVKLNLFKYRSGVGEAKSEPEKLMEYFEGLATFSKNLRSILETKEKVFGAWEKLNDKPSTKMEFGVTALKFIGNVSAKWIEIPESRRCDFQIAGHVTIDPILKLSMTYDFTHIAYKIPKLNLAFAAAKIGMTVLLDDHDMGFFLTVSGRIGLEKIPFDFRKNEVSDKTIQSEPVSLVGHIGINVFALAKGEKKLNVLSVTCEAAGSISGGFRAKIADTNTVYKELKELLEKRIAKLEKELTDGFEPISLSAMLVVGPLGFGPYLAYKGYEYYNHVSGRLKERKASLEEELKSLETDFKDEDNRLSKFECQDGRILFKPKIGCTGLQIYTKAYANVGCSISKSNEFKDPTNFINKKKLVEGKEKKFGAENSWGSEEEKIHAMVGATPVFSGFADAEWIIFGKK